MLTNDFVTVQVGEVGQPACTSIQGECPNCKEPMTGIVPAGTKNTEVTCSGCRRTWKLTPRR